MEYGGCGGFLDAILGGSGRWLLGEWDGEVWESSGGCGGGVSVEKAGLWEFGAEGFWRRILGGILGGFSIWKKHRGAGCLVFEGV